MISLKEKHVEAINTEHWAEKKSENLIEKIKLDETGAFWHQEELFDFMIRESRRLDNKKEKGALYGTSVGVKDLFAIKGLTTTAGSKFLENFKSPYTSTLVEDLVKHDVLIAGKLAMDEFAMGSYSNTSPFGRVSMPGKNQHTAGGSSGGSAGAMNILDFTLGSDTGGSVRQPASFCGYVGYKPSYGAFSRFGMIAYASSLDQAGFFTHSVEDLLYLMSLGLSHADTKDVTSIGVEDNVLDSEIEKVGYFPEILEGNIQEDVKTAYEEVLKKFNPNSLVPIRMKYLKNAIQTYYIVACAEASSNLARYQGVYFGKDIKGSGSYWEQVAETRSNNFGIEVQKRIMLGSSITSSENFKNIYEKANSVRRLLRQEFEDIFKKVNILILPVSPFTSPTWEDIEKKTTSEIYLGDFMTVPFSLAGLPAISLPLAKSNSGMPIGIQVVGKTMSDFDLIKKCIKIEGL